jgi:hypothetical protein
MKSDLEFVVESSKTLESMLERNFGASGRGLHEKIDSVASRLDSQVIRDLRYVATIRNKIVHEDATSAMDDRSRFTQTLQRAIDALSPPPKAPRPTPSAKPEATSPEQPTPSTASEFFAEFEQYRWLASVALGAVLFVVAALCKLPFLVCLLIGATGLFLGYAFGAYLAGTATATFLVACVISAVASTITLLYAVYQILSGKWK